MDELIVGTGVLSVLAFLLHAFEKSRITAGQPQYSTTLMAIAGVIAPFGSLMGMLIMGNRLRDKLMLILVPVMLVLFLLGVYMLRGDII